MNSVRSVLFPLLLLVAMCSLIDISAIASGLPLIQVEHFKDIPGTGKGTEEIILKSPSDVAVAPDGQIYLADGVNNRVVIFSRLGEFLRTIEKVTADKYLKRPLGVFVDTNGNCAIADTGNSEIQIFDSKGLYLRTIPVPSAEERLANPTDVAFDAHSQILYVVDNHNHRIGMLNLKSGFWRFIGTEGPGRNQFRYPFLTELNSQGNILVVDVINGQVKMFGPDLKLIRIIGSWGVNPGQFYRPKGVAVDSQGRIFVSDSYLGVIQVFSADGHPVGILGETKDEKGTILRLNTPVGIAVDRSTVPNRLLVVEMVANRISIYNILQ